MPQPYRGNPDFVSRFVLQDGRAAVLVPREQTQFSSLQDGYPLAEEFLNHLASEDVDAVAIDDGEQIYVFDLYTYRTGNRIGHEPYPMKRVARVDDAEILPGWKGEKADTETTAEWEWLSDDDLEPVTDRTEQSDA